MSNIRMRTYDGSIPSQRITSVGDMVVAARVAQRRTKGGTLSRLHRVYEGMQKSGGDPETSFFYLGGPMTGIAQFNFPRFRKVADLLRRNGYNIISPAELDDAETKAAAMESADGAPGSGDANGKGYNDFLSRDLIIGALPACVGGIFLEGWQNSRGARGESWVLQFLGKSLFEYEDDAILTAFDRDTRLMELGHEQAGVPKDKPGLLTSQALKHPEEDELVEASIFGDPWYSNAGAVEIA